MLTKIQRSYEINHSMFENVLDFLDCSELLPVVNQFQSIAQFNEIMKMDDAVC